MHHFDVIKNQFKQQAANFADKDSNQANGKYIQWILDSLSLETDHKVLDVAAGTGILALAMAPKVSRVTAVDISSDMLSQGQVESQTRNIRNIAFVEGTAEALPFDNDIFDTVVCRFAFHHILEPRQVLLEMKRVCKPRGQIAVIDIVSPEDEGLGKAYNHHEALRDPSHVRALTISDFRTVFCEAQLSIHEMEMMEVEVDFTRWLSLTKPDEEISCQLAQNMMSEIHGGRSTGLRPFVRAGKLYFRHTYAKIIAY